MLGTSAVVLLVAVLGLRFSTRLGLPSLLLYLAIGLLLGESGIGIRFDNAALTQSLGIAALVLILTEGGLTTRWQTVKPALGLGIALSTVAVVRQHRGHRHRAALPAVAWTGARPCCGAPCCRPPTRRPCSACCAGST